MAKVLIDSGPVEATDFLHEVPRSKWRDLMRARERYLAVHLSHDCRCLVEFCNDAEKMFQECGFASPQEMIRDGYGLKPEEIDIALEWLRLNPPKEPISLEQAVALALGRHGGARIKGEKQGGDATLKPSQKNTKAHILARLDRDGHTELAAKVRAGELSANAAAIAAGYRKKPEPFETVLRLLPKLTAGEWAECVRLRAELDELERPAA